MTIDSTHILVLNYNGRLLLAECLPSLVEAARRCSVPCRVSVLDNDSTDGSRDWLASNWPSVGVIHSPNQGLASFNEVARGLREPVLLLLNNDVKLAADAIDPLLRVFERTDDALFSAPLCWSFDGLHYEGMRTRVRLRYGMVQGMSRVPGIERVFSVPDLTAAAGPVLAVDRLRFLEVGGYDPVFFPGRIEDLDFGFRGWMKGYVGYYEPRSIAYHQGNATFQPVLGEDQCDLLATRNTLIFCWKNLSGIRLARHLAWIPPRLAYSVMRGRLGYLRALAGAARRVGRIWQARRELGVGRGSWVEHQERYFRRFAW